MTKSITASLSWGWSLSKPVKKSISISASQATVIGEVLLDTAPESPASLNDQTVLFCNWQGSGWSALTT